jgi:hypothetical protein
MIYLTDVIYELQSYGSHGSLDVLFIRVRSNNLLSIV